VMYFERCNVVRIVGVMSCGMLDQKRSSAVRTVGAMSGGMPDRNVVVGLSRYQSETEARGRYTLELV